jgi:triacylglycerol lipase
MKLGPWLHMIEAPVRNVTAAVRRRARAAGDVLKYSGLLFLGNRVRQTLGEGDIYPRPILLIHGFLGTRAIMMPIERFLEGQDCAVFSINLGVFNIEDIRVSAFRIHRAVERICYDLDIEEIDIIAHSMGGLIGLYYIKKLGGSKRVRKLITLGTPYLGTNVSWFGVATMGLIAPSAWQMLPGSFFLKELHTGPIPEDVEVYALEAVNDRIVPPCAERLPDIKVLKVDFGHTSLVLSDEVFEKIREILIL